jgi:(p)ppGpp synthase/HD superfamily hydrolase
MEDIMLSRDDMPFLAYARNSASFLEWVGERLYAPGTADFSKLERMAKETEELFANETRLTGEPYHTHCFSVALIAAERANVTNPDTLAACIGHDNREFVEEQVEKEVKSSLFGLWTAEGGGVEERYGFAVEQLMAAVTAPRVGGGRSSSESHRLFHERFEKLQDYREFFEVKLPDRTHNLRTLTAEMGIKCIRAKLTETIRWYLRYADRHGLLVRELNHGIVFGETLIRYI